MNQIEAPKTITIDGTEHQVADLGPQVQTLVGIHTAWRTELTEQRLAVAKTEAALRSLEAEIVAAVKKVMEEKAAPSPAPAANDAAPEAAE